MFNNANPAPWYIIDVEAVATKAYYSKPCSMLIPGSDGAPVPTHAHGLKRFIERDLAEILDFSQPINIIGVVGGVRPNERREALYPGYKDRKSKDRDNPILMGERLKCIQSVQALIVALGGMTVSTDYCEADDTIAYLCQRLRGQKVVYTADKDLIQLKSSGVEVVYYNKMVEEYEGVRLTIDLATKTLSQGAIVTLYKSIVGDASDKYPGVTGMGEAAWNSLLELYGPDGLMELAEAVDTQRFATLQESVNASPCKYLSKLLANRIQWVQSWGLAKLRPEWCRQVYKGKVITPKWKKRVPTPERLKLVLEPLGLGEMAKPLLKYCVKFVGMDQDRFNKTDWNGVRKLVEASPLVAFDYETTDKLQHPEFKQVNKRYVDVLSQDLTGCSFAFGENLQYCMYMPCDHAETLNLSRSVIIEFLEYLDTGTTVPMVVQNSAFETAVTQNNLKKKFSRPLLDTRIMVSYANENWPSDLKTMSQYLLNYQQKTYEETVNGRTMRDLTLEEVLQYGCDDSICTAHLAILFQVILQCEGSEEFPNTIDPYFDEVMVPTFLRGIRIDLDALEKMRLEDEVKREALEREIRQTLAERCSEVNEEGFKTLWQETEAYETQKGAEKEMSPAKFQSLMREKRDALRALCKYTPRTPPTVDHTTAAGLSKVCKALGFPALRSIKPLWISKYVAGLYEQLSEPTTDQKRMLELLTDLGDPTLPMFCQSVLAKDPESWVGDELNIDSPAQMAALFYGKMNLPILLRNIDKTADNKRTQWEIEQAPSTDVTAIETWIAELDAGDWRVSLLKKSLKLRAISSLNKLYYKPYPIFCHPTTGRVHFGIKNCGTVTRRPSGSSPNILQVSKKEEGKIRSVFLPEEGHVIVSIDFVQQELVLFAGLCQDPTLLSCYVGKNQRDVHSITGRAVYELAHGPISYEEFVSLDKSDDRENPKVANVKKARKVAKMINFLIVYGGSASGLSRKAAVARVIAKEWYDAFFETYPGARKYQELIEQTVDRLGFVRTCYNSVKHCDGMFNPNKAIAASWRRQAVNATIQGCAADILKKVLKEIVLQEVLEKTGAIIYAPVYDEVVASVPIENVFAYCEKMADIMEISPPGLGVTLSTSVSIGLNWGDQHELKTRPTEQTIKAKLAELLSQP